MTLFLILASIGSMLAAGGMVFLALLTGAIARETEAVLFVVIAQFSSAPPPSWKRSRRRSGRPTNHRTDDQSS
jgi:hypothetical protein